jgi:hypothetical protein
MFDEDEARQRTDSHCTEQLVDASFGAGKQIFNQDEVYVTQQSSPTAGGVQSNKKAKKSPVAESHWAFPFEDPSYRRLTIAG